MEAVFFEKRGWKCIPLVLTQLVLLITWFTPVTQQFPIAYWLIALICFVLFIAELRIMRRKKPVLVVRNDSLFICGLKPGGYKLFQSWYPTEINFRDIEKIEVGKIRKLSSFGITSAPRGEPSKNASAQLFFWISYKHQGRSDEIYYPHTSQIAGFDQVLEALLKALGDKVVLWPPYGGRGVSP